MFSRQHALLIKHLYTQRLSSTWQQISLHFRNFRILLQAYILRI